MKTRFKMHFCRFPTVLKENSAWFRGFSRETDRECAPRIGFSAQGAPSIAAVWGEKWGLGLLLLCVLSPWAVAEDTADLFEALLKEAQLVFTRPSGFVDLPPGRNPILDYERALGSEDGTLEIRIAVRPLQRLRIDYDDPHGAVPDPNHIFPLVFEALASRLAGGRHAPSNRYPPEQARAKFNADWAAAAVFDVAEEFSARHKQGLLVAMHRNKVSDAYVVFLFDDYAAVKALLQSAMKALVYQSEGSSADPHMGPGVSG